MKKITVTIICPGEEEYPGCEDLIRSYPELNLVARYSALGEIGVRAALKCSDVLLIDEAVIELEGPKKVRAIHLDHPGIRTLQIVEKNCEIKAIAAICLGVRGIMERKSMVSILRKAITVLYSGEPWVSRAIVQSLQYQSKYLDGRSAWPAAAVTLPDCERLN